METLGERLKILRLQSGRQTREIILELAVTRQAWHGWETDAHKPGLESLVRISEIFNTTLDWIIRGKGNPPT